MKTKWLSLLVVLALSLGCLAGCGSNAASSASAPASGAAEAAATDSAAEPVPEAQSAEEEPEHQEAPASAEEAPLEESAEEAAEEEPITLPLTTEDVTVEIFCGGSPDQMNFLEDATYTNTVANQEMSRITGVNIVYNTVGNDAAPETFNLMLASNDLPDIIDAFTNFYSLGMDYAVEEEEIIYDLTPYLEEKVPNFYAYLEDHPDVKRDITTDSGIIGGIYALSTGTSYDANGLMIRQELLDQVGKDVPKTYDEFEDTLLAIKNETGVQGALIYRNFFGQFFAGGFGTYAKLTTAPDINYPIYQVDGEVRFAPLTEEYREYIETIQRWYCEGLIYQDYYVYANPGDIGNEILKGDCAVCMGMYDELVTRNRDGGFNYVPMADLVKQEGDIIHTGTAAYQEGDITAGNVQVITNQTENLDLILELYNFSFSEESSRIASYGVEGETFEYVDGKPQLTDLVLNNPDISIRHSTGVYLTTIASVIDQGRTASTVTDGQIEAYNIWLSNTDDAYTLDARVLALTTEEADTINRVAGDILTRLEEANIQFITGAMNTTTDYDAFVSEMESMGIQDMIDAYQAAYDRYLDR